jgi:outer membrane receptor protein involved in Fe transport
VAKRSWDNQRSEFLYLSGGLDQGALAGLSAGFIYASKNGGLGEHWLNGYSPKYDDLTWTQMIPYVKYQRPLSRSVVLNAWFKTSRDTEKATAAAAPGEVVTKPGPLVLLYGASVSSYEALAEVRWEPAPSWNVIGGIDASLSYQNDGPGDYGGMVVWDPTKPSMDVFVLNTHTLTSSDLFQTYSGFLQVSATLPVLAGLHMITGARLDAGQAIDDRFWQLSPRAGVVQELTETLSLKLLVDTALRAPGIKETGLNKEVRPELVDPGDAPAVKPETMRSLEAGLALHTTHVSANVALFVNETRDALDGRDVDGRDGTKNVFANTPGKVSARGAEIEVAVAASADARLFANYAYARATLDPYLPGTAGAKNLADVPVHRINAGASYRVEWPLDLTGTLVAKWVNRYRTAAPTPEAPAPPAPRGQLVVDANAIARLTEHASLELMVRNLGGASYKLPRIGVPTVPMPERTFHLTFDYRF